MASALRVKVPFATSTRVFPAGVVVAPDDPVVKGNETYFESVDALVEQATAAPGEKRSVGRPRKAAAKKAD